ncbi:MAG: recombination mediator RecR [Gammaproteobacteria bacterium]|nr:recombination mediator RecR [Gammaproteobacteria bacterium]MDH3467771.1 recombination mediator RecR [Gammaproteobacteria bacterium]
MDQPKAIELLKQALRRLPGVGPKTAQRMAFHLLERDRAGARLIADALLRAVDKVSHCERCNNFSENALCDICGSDRRDASLLCIVETPADLESVENSSVYKGMYFVLMGHLSPLDDIGPDELGIDRLLTVLDRHTVNEIILATNLTSEGEATADYVSELTRDRDIKITRLARGLPVGGELEYMDQGTLAQAFGGRRPFS